MTTQMMPIAAFVVVASLGLSGFAAYRFSCWMTRRAPLRIRQLASVVMMLIVSAGVFLLFGAIAGFCVVIPCAACVMADLDSKRLSKGTAAHGNK